MTRNWDDLMGAEVRINANGYTGTVYARIGGPITTYRVTIGGRDAGRPYRANELTRLNDPDKVRT